MCICSYWIITQSWSFTGCIGHQIKPWMCYTSVLDQYWYLTNKSQQKYIQSKFFQTSCIFVSNTILNILIVRSLPSWQRKGISPFMRWQYHGFLYKEAEQQQLLYWPRLCGMIQMSWKLSKHFEEFIVVENYLQEKRCWYNVMIVDHV